MLTAVQNNEPIMAQDATKTDGQFTCSWCNELVILKKGSIKIPHFAHKTLANCDYNENESEKHKQCKLEIYNTLKVNDIEAHLEYKLDGIRPDIYIPSLNVGIEVQLSNISIEKITQRTDRYKQLGIAVLWTSITNLESGSKKSVSGWELFLHRLYFGKIYFWERDITFIPISFAKSTKQTRYLKHSNSLNLLKDFRIYTREEWGVGSSFTPAAKLYIEKYRR